MAQPLGSAALMRAYASRLKSSHDFRVEADILTMEEVPVGRARMLDGQVNINESNPRRTASMLLADPAGALDFSAGSAYSGSSLWANRLVRVRHILDVPGFGEVTAVPFIGVPTSISRSGGEVQVELADKSSLALTGCQPMTVPKGTYAHNAIILFLRYRCGEFRFRVPAHTKRTSRAYAVGWDDAASPWLVCQQIARAELGLRLDYSNDGYVTLRPLPSSSVYDAGFVTQPADASVDFSAVKNTAVVTGGLVSKTKGRVTTSTRASSTASASPSSTISPEYLKRQGVVRRLPVIVQEDGYTTTAQTSARAKSEVLAGAVQDSLKVSCVPVFHLDNDDIVTITADDESRTVRLSSGSIPFGVGGDTGGEGSADMSIGAVVWASSRATPRVSSRLARSRKVKPLTKTQRKALAKKRRGRRR